MEPTISWSWGARSTAALQHQPLTVDFLAHSVPIKLALPQAALLSFSFSLKVENQLCCTSTRDLIKDAPLIERFEREKREKSRAPSGSRNRTRDISIRSPMRYHLSYHPASSFSGLLRSSGQRRIHLLDSNLCRRPEIPKAGVRQVQIFSVSCSAVDCFVVNAKVHYTCWY